MRCLFVNWKDGTSCQYTVPDDYQLPRALLHRRKRPHRLILPSPTDPRGIEAYLDVRDIRSALCVTLGADQRIIDTAA